jgi:small-conductance mechanosensitive channel
MNRQSKQAQAIRMWLGLFFIILGGAYVIYYFFGRDQIYRLLAGLAFVLLGLAWHFSVRRGRKQR